MKNPNQTCICCTRVLPYHSFALGNKICNPCNLMTPNDVAITTRMNMERALALRAETAAGRKEQRILAKHEAYALTGKRCSCCHHYLPVTAFGVCATRGDGLQANCKACNKLHLGIKQSGGSVTMWHTVRDALRAAATGPLNQQASANN